MSNRTDLSHAHAALEALDLGLECVNARVTSAPFASRRIGRARSFIRAARNELGIALLLPVDGVVTIPAGAAR